MAITQLGYVGLGIDRARQADWELVLGSVFGMDVRDDGDGVLRARYDDHDARLLLEGGDNDLAFLGWQVSTREDLAEMTAAVEAAGIEVQSASDDERERRRVLDMVWFRDPDGLRTELYFGPLLHSLPLLPGRPHNGFVAGPFGAGHVVVAVADRDNTALFYCDVLGFRLSDYGRGRLAFLRCNRRHHSIGLMPAAMSDSPRRLVHVMVQNASLDDVGIAFDRCLDVGVPVVTAIGKHANDQSVSFYLRTPGGFELECGWGSREVDGEDSWEAGRFAAGLLWGGQPVTALADQLKDQKTLW